MSGVKSNRVAVERRLGLAQHLRNDWVFDAEEGTTVEEIIDPAYWSLVANRISHGDRIDVRLETGEWIAELLVIDKEVNWVRVHLLKLHELVLPAAAPPVPKQHEVFWRGSHHKFAVRRLSDKEVVQNGFIDKAAAFEWIANRERAVALA